MSILLPHNPIYLRNVRMQTRPGLVMAVLGGAIVVVSLVLALAARMHDPNGAAPWEATALCTLLALAGFVAVNACAVLVGGAAAGERLLGTLDVHRVGPSRPVALVAGFVVGAPALVWVLLLALAPVCLSLGLRAGLALGPLAGSLVSVATTALVASLATLALALGAGQSSRASLQTAGLAVGTGLLSLGYVGHVLHIAPLYYLSGVAPMVALAVPGSASVPSAVLFGLPVPQLFYQALCQGAAIICFGGAAVRLAGPGGRLPWTKIQMLTLCAFTLALFLGSMPGHPWFAGEQAPAFALAMGYAVLAVGVVAAVLVTPRHIHHARAWRRLQTSEDSFSLAAFDDGAGNFAWYLVYCALAMVAATAGLLLVPPRDVSAALCILLLALFQTGWIAGGLETYYLSRHSYRRGAFFMTAAFPWLLFPMVGLWMRLDGGYPMFAPMLLSLSPVTGLWHVGKNATAAAGDWQSMEAIRTVAMPLLLNGCLAAATLLSAWVTRQRMHQA
jgi:hypothetical protein